jgi:hypothetical protein
MDSSLVVLDPRGDLHLEVGDAPEHFLVCARAMARASKVWDKMLFGNWAESKQKLPANTAATWLVTFPDDDPTAVELILNIIHGRFNKVPTTLPTEELYNLTILTDKYDLTWQLSPWADIWFQDVTGDKSMMLWIAWELGARQKFQSLADSLVMDSTHAELQSVVSIPSTITPPRLFGKDIQP